MLLQCVENMNVQYLSEMGELKKNARCQKCWHECITLKKPIARSISNLLLAAEEQKYRAGRYRYIYLLVDGEGIHKLLSGVAEACRA